MRTLIPELQYEHEIPETMRGVISTVYEYAFGDPNIICIGMREGSTSLLFSVTQGFDKNKYPSLFNSFYHHSLVYDASDKDMMLSDWTIVYSTQHTQYVDFLYSLPDYKKRLTEILLKEKAQLGLKFSEYSMNLLSTMAIQIAMLSYSNQSGTVQPMVFPISDEALSYYLRSLLKPYEIRLILQYYAIPVCGIPVSKKQYDSILSVIVKEVTLLQNEMEKIT